MRKFMRATVSGLLPLGLLIAAPFQPAYAQQGGGVSVIEANQPPVAVFAPLRGNSGGHGGGKTDNLSYRGGAVQTAPKIYLVLWGSQWNNNDPSGEANILENFYSGVGGSSWLSTVTQYCKGVANGTVFCNGAGMPASNQVTFAGVWPDNASAAPSSPSQSQLAAEAVKAAQYFGNTTSSLNLNAQYVVATATGNSANGFGSSYCAWHSATSSSVGIVSYTNLPYMTDAGAACGANFNNLGPYAGITIVSGHEMAESITDPNPDSGWLDSHGSEIGDKCAWISSGQGATASVMFSTGYYPVQSLWSNAFSGDAGGCVQ